jgi:hypothetical protein
VVQVDLVSHNPNSRQSLCAARMQARICKEG